ncbi:hypothetical protein [Haloplanus aerogenes]|uniref:Uncharacterized protein n=1 Tax=Haloplanus aerogenes TaxID=660522 RepID=A0A3M0CF47_9EURY|nr:hypothetical protein [Haloplanus aerogenes]AZH26024.1 hypothetical protein DU502_11925 [Haloplanus aerogenes]RMB08244.1 hypothetical protein ATH50_3659 [Haloplanus aerogenes]
MSDKESVNLRIEQGLKDTVANVAINLEGDSRPSDLSKTARKLILIGLGARQANIEPDIVGPLGVIPRPFAEISFGGEKVTMGTQLRAETLEELQAAFETKKHPAAREALRLGLIIVQSDNLKMEGPLGGPRPFANINVEEHVVGEEARQALHEIKAALDI